MEKMSYSKALKFGGFTYLGSVAQSAKTNMARRMVHTHIVSTLHHQQ